MWTQAKIPGANRAALTGAVLVAELDLPLSPPFVKIVLLPPSPQALERRLSGWQPHGQEGPTSATNVERNETKVIWQSGKRVLKQKETKHCGL